tara:strand:+ start:117 stop:596 length:480 start_codon:yes stop_codon:yes gene_type:complete
MFQRENMDNKNKWVRDSNNRLVRHRDIWEYESISYDDKFTTMKVSENTIDNITLIEGAKLTYDEGYYLDGSQLNLNRYNKYLYNILNGYIYDYEEYYESNKLIHIGQYGQDLFNSKSYIYIHKDNSYLAVKPIYYNIIKKSKYAQNSWDILESNIKEDV